MKNENEDLLEIYDDDDNKSSYDYFEANKADRNDKAWSIMFVCFMVLLAIKFYQSLPGDGPNESAILLRQVRLINIIKRSQDDEIRMSALIEYDSLQQVLDSIPSN